MKWKNETWRRGRISGFKEPKKESIEHHLSVYTLDFVLHPEKKETWNKNHLDGKKNILVAGRSRIPFIYSVMCRIYNP